jgi:hypothetical protein
MVKVLIDIRPSLVAIFFHRAFTTRLSHFPAGQQRAHVVAR